MLLAAVVLMLVPQAAGAVVPERAAGLVVMLGERMPEDGVPELRERRGERVSLSIGNASSGQARAPQTDRRAFELSPDVFRPADDVALARAARSAQCVSFGAGALRSWYLQLFPNRHKSELVHALHEARRFGTTIVGRGDAAALLAGATVAADERELGERESNPHKLGLPRRVWGMAYEPRVIVDLESRAHGSLARLLEVMLAEHFQLGAWIADDAALIGDTSAEKLTCRGSRVLVLDLRGARHVQSKLLGAHLSILLDGDAWLERSRALESAEGTSAVATAGVSAERDVSDVFDAAALCNVIAEHAHDTPATIVVRDAHRTLSLTFDADSALIARSAKNSVACSRVRLDLEFER